VSRLPRANAVSNGGTSKIGAGKLSRYRIFVGRTGAVSRNKLSRSQKTVTVQDLDCVQMRALPDEALRSWVSGCKNHYKFVLGAGAKVEERSDEIPPWRGKNRDDFPLHGTTCPVQREVVPRSGKQLTHIVRVTVSIF
jgi:hypothetical protein